ncbi:MAG: DUF389 domain-containing protein [Leptospiraceae bacterium]|nr:DUF389 domain-containing protein [Leptospiraceae bacterium]
MDSLVQVAQSLLNVRHEIDEEGTVESIKKGIDFKGGNLWSLIFAIFIASVGLNTNSPAVIIGAMLISPLMGPIMGAGLAVGIYDFPLLKKSLRNLSVAAVASIITSAIYFAITPLTEVQSELLARTKPTIYDVIIAIFGGAAGIMAGARKDKTNAIPGVAIATALMPPLCTAGFGIATGRWTFFLGAFYLFFINTLFIAISTVIFVRLLNFRRVTFVDMQTQKKVRLYIIIFAIITIIPSIYMAWTVVTEAIFKARANRYVTENFTFPNSKVLNHDLKFSARGSTIEISVIGQPLSDEIINLLEGKLDIYGLENVRLKVNQSRQTVLPQKTEDKGISKDFLTNLYKNNEELIKSKDDRIKILENELLSFKNKQRLLPSITKEISFLFPKVESFSFGDLLFSKTEDFSSVKEPTVLVKWKKKPSDSEIKTMILYLKSRLEIENLKEVSQW